MRNDRVVTGAWIIGGEPAPRPPRRGCRGRRAGAAGAAAPGLPGSPRHGLMSLVLNLLNPCGGCENNSIPHRKIYLDAVRATHNIFEKFMYFRIFLTNLFSLTTYHTTNKI